LRDRRIGHRVPENPSPPDWLAKSGSKKRLPGFRTDYRREFGSLLDVVAQDAFKELIHDPQGQELILHVIAAHHGRARPLFPRSGEVDEAFDPEPNGRDTEQAAAKVPRRFARLQHQYGRWGLAYLESLLRAADWAASANESVEVH
jgi:CRISPR-associated endonuclease/helicase Cas3